MNHNHLFYLLIVCGGILPSTLLRLDGTSNILIVSIINAILIVGSYLYYYKNSRPKSSPLHVILISFCLSIIIIFLINFLGVSISGFGNIFVGLISIFCIFLFLQSKVLSKKDMFILPNLPKHQVNLLPFGGTIVIGLVIYISPFLSSGLENIQEKQAIDFASIIDRESDAESLSTSGDLSPVLKQYFGENEIVTYKSLLPVLREKYDGEFRSQNVDFSYITKESVLYPSFAYAFQMGMIGAGLDPDLSVKCKNLMVILGLAESWILDYTSENIIQNFWDTSQSKGLLENGCSSLDTVVLGKMLP